MHKNKEVEMLSTGKVQPATRYLHSTGVHLSGKGDPGAHRIFSSCELFLKWS